MYVLINCHFVNCFGFVFVGLFSSFPPLLSYDLMMIFNVVFGLLFLFCVYIYYWFFLFMVTMRFWYRSLYDTLLSCRSLINFKYIFKILHSYSFPLMITGFDIVFVWMISYLYCMWAFLFPNILVPSSGLFFSLQSSFSICSKADAEFS